ncbi:MAG: hypothetical protein FWB80_10215 [Defluviitaleaceae bacterium]|nr:hypothetical protein [Defluviitaleaceae bacterium]MCL2199287.1 hypothetical protein [Defluviitaleaceae bacterium]
MIRYMKFKILVILALIVLAVAVGLYFYTPSYHEQEEFGGTFVRSLYEHLYKTQEKSKLAQ